MVWGYCGLKVYRIIHLKEIIFQTEAKEAQLRLNHQKEGEEVVEMSYDTQDVRATVEEIQKNFQANHRSINELNIESTQGGFHVWVK